MSSISAISGSDLSDYVDGDYQAMRGIASSSDGRIIYVSVNQNANMGVVKSSDFGATWSVAYPYTAGFTSIACSSDGNIVYGAWLGNGLFTSTDAGSTWNQVTFSPSNALPGGISNPEINDSHFGGYKLTNNYQVACDSTGTQLIMTTNAAASIYRSTDSGVTWSLAYAIPGYVTNPTSPTYVASNADGTILYAALNNTGNPRIVVSKDAGVTWENMNMHGVSGILSCLSTNNYGDFVFCVDSNSKLNIFYPTHTDSSILVPSAGNTLVALANYNNGNNLIITQNNYQTITGGAFVSYSLVNKYSPGQPSSVPCFKDDSRILCCKDGRDVYVNVQDIRKGDLVKTWKHGYVPVNMIGTTQLYNSGDTLRGQNRLYVCSPDKYPELTEDLILTGCHSILEDELTQTQRDGTVEMLGRIMVTDDKYRLMACLDERATPYLEEGVFRIWHIALDHTSYYMNYGIYANGLLVETCSKRYLKELSGMTLALV